jgi:transposase
MIRTEDFAVMKSLHQRGVFQKDIAFELGVHPRTVSRALKRDGAPEREQKSSESKLDPYKPTIDRLLSEGVWNAKVIWREIEAEGYTGRYTILRDYIQPKRALRPGRATVGEPSGLGRCTRSVTGPRGGSN